MEVLLIILLVLAGFILFAVFKNMRTQKYLKTLSEEQFKEGYRKAELIDVREPKEYDRGHILGARNIPMSQMKQRNAEIRKDKPVYLYCQRGSRSLRAANFLRKKGYKELYQLKGGFSKWNGKIKVKKKGY
ncbi:rhodanese-like domain-containing protein [Halalkalibacillus halophilus]|uniref:rhodanese-like domain-containing protein n=1 Tax=Halalkalibacillus halophilus TaxID=392827 RepID=UPI00040C3811|nr:rhodanese-like domain-containing protein [Halalkalibacillus halophilus]